MSSLMSPATTLALGLLLGVRHATDPDHVVAVSAMVSRERSIGRAALLGLSWGVGHSLTVVAAGGAMIFFDLRLPPRLGLGLELAVAVMLIALGAVNVRAFGRARRAAATARPARPTTEAPPEASSAPRSRSSFARSAMMGIVHGLAGSAAIAMVVVASIADESWALLYLFLFGLGTIGGMVAITAALGLPFVAAKAAARVQTRVVMLTGVVSILVGVGVAYQVVVTGGWLSASPTWTPR
jgi:hypothetical protein